MLIMRKLHKWLGLIVGLQVILWTLSGLVFAWLDHHDVSAEHSVREIVPKPISLGSSLAEPREWLNQPNGAVYQIQLVPLVDATVWRVESEGGTTLHRPEDGALIQPDERIIRQLAVRSYAGAGRLQSIAFEADSSIEARGAGAVWRAEFDDPSRTTLYFAADDARLVATRNASWRWFDFFWMLHTMDYRSRDNFNNPLVITIGTASLWLALTGFILLFRSFRREDFAWITGRTLQGPR